jgi:hypothetical protein
MSMSTSTSTPNASWYDVGVGKGAWDCDAKREILPENEGAEFEEIPTADAPRFEHLPDVPTVPPRKDFERVSAWWDGCRYRVTFDVNVGSVIELKRALIDGGMGRGDDMTTGKRRTVERAEDVVLFYRGEELVDDEKTLKSYEVPRGCKILLCIRRDLVERAKAGFGPPCDSYWA